MQGRVMFFLVLFVIALLMEAYVFYAFRSVITSIKGKKLFSIVYIIQSLVVMFAFYRMYQAMQSGAIIRGAEVNTMIGIIFTSFITKIVFSALMLMQDGGRAFIWLTNQIRSLFDPSSNAIVTIPERRTFLTNTAIAIAGIPFFSLIYGITKGKYNYKINNLKLAFSNLPNNFNGLRIVQISDIHAGSLDDINEVNRGIELINKQKPDLILFTGDLVNSKKDEINPYIESFSKLEAKYGKYAILGNHDYYGLNDVPEEEHIPYWKDFFAKFNQMGFTLLNNENQKIVIGDESIQLVGVENWGAGRFFPKKGDLDLALTGVENDDFCVLMSHDPTHWDEKVVDHHKKIDITLSGHTHGMQFGINMPGFKWSPAKYRYKHWMGLYENKGQYLYVNRGFGFLAFPGRVGMWPEITVMELKTV